MRSEKEREETRRYDVYKDLSYHEYVDQESQSSKRLSQPSQNSKMQSQTKKQPTSKTKFIIQFPNHIRSYIKDVVNVESDGNCGYRVIASMHGYSEDGWPIVHRDLDNEIRDRTRLGLYHNLFGDRYSKARGSLMIDDLSSQPPSFTLEVPS